MATELAKAYVQIIPSAEGIQGKLSSALGEEASGAGDAAGKAAGNSLVASIKKVVVAAGIGQAIKKAITEGADLQQSLGGIETLFKDSADMVIENAKNAYKTAGMSANEYMETVTSFSASLLQGLAGDTNKAADIADMALTDMSDNANKMGTSMDLIQNAYQGFAKQNYTMLDNLKLGYGGTKTEMERLLADAQKLTGVKYDMDNLSDVYEAIHVIQEEMGITGTTAKEAASTFSGSLASMKAAFSNVLGNLSLGEDIGPSLHALRDTVSTFLVNNLAPMIGNILSNLPEVVEGIGYLAYDLLNSLSAHSEEFVQGGVELVGKLITGIISTLPYLAESVICIGEKIAETIINTDWIAVATEFLSSLGGAISLGIGECFGGGEMTMAMTDSIIAALPSIAQTIQDVFTALWDGVKYVWETVGQPIWDAVVSVFQYVADNWGAISESIKTYFQTVCDFLSTVWTTVGQPIWDMISFAIGSVANLFAEHMPAIMAFFREAIAGIQDTWNNHLKPVFDAIGDCLNNIIKPAFEFVWKTIIEPLITNVFDTIKRLWNGTLKPVFDGICDFLAGTFTGDWKKSLQGVLNIVTGIFNAIQVAVEKPMDLVKDIVNKAIEFVKEKFDFEWSLPKLKMPHFTISGSFSLNPLSVPSFDIEWYAKGAVLQRPTIFGINPSSGNAMVGGEAGPETIAPITTLQKYIKEAVRANNSDVVQMPEIDYERMGEEVAKALERANLAVKYNGREFGRVVREVI